MAGYVWEWVSDWYGEYYCSTLEPGVVNPQGPEEGTERALRGHSWIGVAVVRMIALPDKKTPDT
jgi:formylglycine-generating enzyme required for sulfatase activity